MMSSTAVPRKLSAALISSLTCLGSPAKDLATNPQLETTASRQMSTGMNGFCPIFFSTWSLSAVAENWPFVRP